MTMMHRLARRVRRLVNRNIYQAIYESHAAGTAEDEAVGNGRFGGSDIGSHLVIPDSHEAPLIAA